MKNNVIHNIRLDINREKNKAVIHVRAGETKARSIHFTITDRGVVRSLDDVIIAIITVIKPDGSHCYNDLSIQDNELHYELTTQTVNVPGECACDIELTFADKTRIIIPGFTIMVYEKYLSDRYVESQNEYKAVPVQVALSKEYAESAGKAASASAESESKAAKSEADAENILAHVQELELQCQRLKEQCTDLYESLVNMGFLELGTTHATAYYGDLGKVAYDHSQNVGNPHQTTYKEVGADAAGTAQLVYENVIAYIDKAIADLINGAPTTLDTLKEIADAMKENEDVVVALEAAIGAKADATETTSLISHLDTRVTTLEDSNGYPIS